MCKQYLSCVPFILSTHCTTPAQPLMATSAKKGLRNCGHINQISCISQPWILNDMRFEEENVGYGSQYDTSVGVAFLFLTIGGLC